MAIELKNGIHPTQPTMENINIVGFYVAIFILIAFVEVGAIDDYCSKYTYNDSGNYMHFSKEATFEEFALKRKFKGLSCCAKGYRSIEW